MLLGAAGKVSEKRRRVDPEASHVAARMKPVGQPADQGVCQQWGRQGPPSERLKPTLDLTRAPGELTPTEFENR